MWTNIWFTDVEVFKIFVQKDEKKFRFMKYLKIVLKETFIYVIITTEKLQ